MAFWTFGQNNSGGSFDFDVERGITHFVIIEASSEAECIARAKSIGLYFDGCATGVDCDCCGDRWSAPWEDGSEFPSVYGHNVRETGSVPLRFGGWMDQGREAAVHPLVGPIEWYGAVRETLSA